MRLAVDAYNFPKTHLDNVHSVLLGEVGRLLKEINSTDDSEEDGKNTDVKDTDKIVATDKSQAKEQTSKQAKEQTSEQAKEQTSEQVKEQTSEEAKEQTSEQVGNCDSTQEDQSRIDSSDGTVSKVDVKKSEGSQGNDSVAMETSSRENGGKEEKRWKGKRKIETVGWINNILQCAKTSSSIIFIQSNEISLYTAKFIFHQSLCCTVDYMVTGQWRCSYRW